MGNSVKDGPAEKQGYSIFSGPVGDPDPIQTAAA